MVTAEPKKILIILGGSIGDVTRALPLANVLREAYPRARLAWAVEPPSYPLIERHRAVDQAILFDRSRWWRSLAPFLWRIRRERFDLVLDLQRLFKSGLISRWSGAPRRVGFHPHDAKEFNWWFNNHYIPSAGETVSKLDHYLKFAEFLELKPSRVEWTIPLSPDDRARVATMLAAARAPFAVFLIGSRWESKQWFAAETAASAAEVHRRFGLGVVLLGGKEHLAFAREVAGMEPSPVLDLVGQTSLREAVGILGEARVVVGPDTGLMHLAAAVGTPVVSLWGATSPLRAGPHGYDDLVVRGTAPCAPCYLRRCPIGRICMQSIDVAEVVTAVARALRRNEAAYGVEV
jgi:lipopolysaccharide heptosyltransferase II